MPLKGFTNIGAIDKIVLNEYEIYMSCKFSSKIEVDIDTIQKYNS